MKPAACLLCMTLTLAPLSTRAQELEYALELGLMGGASFYLGDANYHSLYKATNLGGGLLARYNINPRTALKFNIACANISGDATKHEYKYPENANIEWQFDKTLIDVGAQCEFAFWGYGTGAGYKGSKPLAPYLQVGIGFTSTSGAFTMNIPVGFGVKYKFKERWNIGIDWTMRFALSDKLDGIENPYNIQSGFLKNKDSYSLTMLYISYDLCPKYRKCNND